jgi:hypothetical protein
MAAGMPLYGLLFISPLDPLGYRSSVAAHPYAGEVLMLGMMSLPMVGFMAYRRHSVGSTIEMVAAMAIPSLAVIGLTSTSLVPWLTLNTMSVASHAAMLVGMLLAVLYRRAEYAGVHVHGHGVVEPV